MEKGGTLNDNVLGLGIFDSAIWNWVVWWFVTCSTSSYKYNKPESLFGGMNRWTFVTLSLKNYWIDLDEFGTQIRQIIVCILFNPIFPRNPDLCGWNRGVLLVKLYVHAKVWDFFTFRAKNVERILTKLYSNNSSSKHQSNTRNTFYPDNPMTVMRVTSRNAAS